MGITYSYHRQLAHKSFRSPKWLEYLAAICGMCALQGAPLDWVSDHRYHHLHTETPLDPHSSFEGFYWSHLGWMLDSTIYEQRCGDSSNVADLAKQPFYQLTSKYYFTGFFFLHWGLIAAVGGLAGVVWRAFFTSLLYHVVRSLPPAHPTHTFHPLTFPCSSRTLPRHMPPSSRTHRNAHPAPELQEAQEQHHVTSL